jgi:GNAT-family acetyltransferase (TIGR03103 family)
MAAFDGGAHPSGYDDANRYTQVIVDEALRRGIDVVIVDPSIGELVLTRGDRRVRTIESLSELTNAVAFRRCDDKVLTRRVLGEAGLVVPAGRLSTSDAEDLAFLEEHGELVVKPRRGEQGWGITVGVVDEPSLLRAVEVAREVNDDVLLERLHPGDDLRIVVIGGEVVAASVRRPPSVTGDGRRTIAELVVELSESRARETHGASTIELDDLTSDVVAAAGHSLEAVLPSGETLVVRRTANVHTGGTIDDVTDDLHPDLAAVAVRAAAVLDIPVVGLDLIAPSPSSSEYVIIEANEQPGLANHEPRPTVERFVDLLFPD